MKLLVTLLLMLSASFAFAQENTDQKGLDGGTINDQFEYVIKKSNKYQDYKVVKKEWLLKLQTNIGDSIKQAVSKRNEAKAALSTANAEIGTLKKSITEGETALSEANGNIENVTVFGAATTKMQFKTITGAIIGGLLLVLALGLLKFKSAMSEAKKANEAKQQAQSELEDYRKTAMQREQALARQLQDERNKNNP